MSDTVVNPVPSPAPQPHDFIFKRELAEVYLLLDFVSGRSDKSLSAAFAEAGPPPGMKKEEVPTDTKLLGQAWINKICQIGWPPGGTPLQLADQATMLLAAKDQLNFAAKPANGASVAFSVLVAGDDESKAVQRIRNRGYWRRLFSWLPFVRRAPEPPDEDDDGGIDTAGSNWGGRMPPSRFSLARMAYPGLFATAVNFAHRINQGFVLLFIWLIVTCLLSWNVAVGHALVLRLDSIETARLAIVKRLAEVGAEDKKRPADGQAQAPAQPAAAETAPPPAPPPAMPPATTPSAAPPATPPAASGTAAAQIKHVYCESYLRTYNPALASLLDEYKDGPSRQIVCELGENRYQYKLARENLADWLVPWDVFKKASHWWCGGRCLAGDEPAKSVSAPKDQWAATLLEVLAAAVLPFCYGLLGAGAAVVRGIWDKMRKSLLAPRDLRLAYGQLALGAVIGACIGLFVASPSNTSQSAMSLFNGPVALSASALSFIAGFGVESIFVALESLIKRIFNTT